MLMYQSSLAQPDAVENIDGVREFVKEHGYPVMLKAARGGGGRGMRIATKDSELEEAFQRASSEAKAAVGDGRLFVERLSNTITTY